MTTQSPSPKLALGAALAATIADEKKNTEDRFAKAERLLKMSTAAPVITAEQLAKPAAPGPQPTRAPQDSRLSGGGGSRLAKLPVIHEKVIRDTFTFPPGDHKRIKNIIQEGLQAAIQVNKSEVIRAGLIALQGLPADKRHALLESVEKMKPGRPVE